MFGKWYKAVASRGADNVLIDSDTYFPFFYFEKSSNWSPGSTSGAIVSHDVQVVAVASVSPVRSLSIDEGAMIRLSGVQPSCAILVKNSIFER